MILSLNPLPQNPPLRRAGFPLWAWLVASWFEFKKANLAAKENVVISDIGDSDYLVGDVVNKVNVKDMNKEFSDSKKTLIKFKKAIDQLR